MRNLDKEYITKKIIYEKQKEYRKTEGGKLALRRAKEKQLLKTMKSISKSLGGGNVPHCFMCGQLKFEFLTVSSGEVICYNCKYRRPKVLTEEEICQ